MVAEATQRPTVGRNSWTLLRTLAYESSHTDWVTDGVN